MEIRKRTTLALVGLIMSLALVGVDPQAVAKASRCPSLPTTLRELIAADASKPHPLSERYPRHVWRYTEGAAACFGDARIGVAAFVRAPEGIGGTSAFAVRPRWLLSERFVAVDASPRAPRRRTEFFPVAVPPALVASFDSLTGRWVSIVGRFQHPAADKCRVVDGEPPDAPPPDVTIEICRTAFVVTSIRPLVALPATDAAAIPDTSPTLPRWLPLLVLCILPVAMAYADNRIARRLARRRPILGRPSVDSPQVHRRRPT